MADVDIAAVIETTTASESVALGVAADPVTPSVNDGITVAESVTTPAFALKLYRGTNSVTVSLISLDWDFMGTYRKFKNVGIPLKGMIFIPGSGAPDTFSIKDGSDAGAYLYKGAVSATTVVVYPGSLCHPYVDFSECTLSAGHSITFVW